MLHLWQAHNPCMHGRASPTRLFEGKSLKVLCPMVDCQNAQLQRNLSVKAEIRYHISMARYLRGAQLEQWMLEELGSLEFCKSSQVYLKGCSRKVRSEILEPFYKAGKFSKAWWAFLMELFWALSWGFQIVLFRNNLLSHSQRSWSLVVDCNFIFLQEGRVVGEKSFSSYSHRDWYVMSILLLHSLGESREG